MNKKAVIGIGTLIIFIATIVVSMVAAGVLVRSTGLLQERALFVEETARERLISGIEVYAVYAQGDRENQTISEFEFHIRLRPGSNPIQMRTLSMAFDTQDRIYAAELNASLVGDVCTFDVLTDPSEYCYLDRFGNKDTVLEEGELFILRFKVPEEQALETFVDFEATFTPRVGSLELLSLRTPEIVLTNRIRLR
jgi:flagellin FlaB